MPELWLRIPVVVWVFAGLLLLALARYAQLWVRRSANAAVERDAVRGLRLLYDGLATFAKSNASRWPASLSGDDWAFARDYVVRPTPRWGLDARLVLAYDRIARHRLIEFPALLLGRAVLLGTGKIVVLSQAQFEQILRADDRLREALGLDVADSGNET
jgi:hypothetical protein